MSIRRSGRGFTLIELLVVIAIIALLIGILLPALGRARLAGQMAVSLNNCRQIMIGFASYRHEQRDELPMRLSYLQSGAFGGIDTWSYGGKNNDRDWKAPNWPGSSEAFDEPAYTRLLNPYLYGTLDIPVPDGYRGFVREGASLRFYKGSVTDEDRENLELTAFRSPGDKNSRQRVWPDITPKGISSYDDVGTSYHTNLRWLEEILPGGGITEKAFLEGMRRMRMAEAFDPKFVILHDQTADIVANDNQRRDWMGEFGDRNKSVMAFGDGRADYIYVEPGETRTREYNFFFELYDEEDDD